MKKTLIFFTIFLFTASVFAVDSKVKFESKAEFASFSEWIQANGYTPSFPDDPGDIIEQWASPNGSPMEIEWDPDDDFIWHVSENAPNDCMYQIEVATPHNIIASYPAPNPYGIPDGESMNGACIANGYFYYTDYNGDITTVDDHIVQVDRNTLTAIDQWETDPLIDQILGITYKDPYFYIVCNSVGFIYEVDLQPGGVFTIINSIPAPGGGPLSGIHYLSYNETFWIASFLGAVVYETDSSFNILQTISAPAGANAIGITWPGEGENYWLTDFGNDQFYIIDGDIVASVAPPEAPAAPSNLVVTPDAGGALEALIEWVCPTEQVNGNPLTELLEMRVYRGEDLIYTDTTPGIGDPGNYTDVSVSSSGIYTYKVVGYNSFGEGAPATESVWVGEDVPNAVTDLTLTDVSTDDLAAQLDWVNPTTGLHGGYFPGVTGYDIERMDGATFTIAGPVTQWIDDTITDPDIYWYTVTPFNNTGPGPSETSPQVGIGVSIVQIGVEEVGDYQIPINLWYMDSMVECIYLQEWIGTDMLINAISYHANTSSTLTNEYHLEVWMGITAETDLSAGWIDGSQLTQVFSGMNNVPPGDSWIDIPLDTPFEYDYSGNLVVMAIRDDDEYYSTADLWWCTESGTSFRTRHAYEDNAGAQAFNAMTGPFTSTYEKSIYPDVRFTYSPLEHGDVDGVITDNVTANPIEGVEVYIGSWGPATTNALGEYLIEGIVTGIQDVSAFKAGYYDFFGQVEVLADVVVTYDIGMDPNLFGELDGTVTDADTGAPLVGAQINAISAGGYEYDTVTNNDGDYVIPNMVVETYDVFCSFPNYPTEVVENVLIEDGLTTTVDFALEGYAYWCDFENSDGGLISDNPNGWQWGIPANGPASAYSGDKLWGTVLNSNYPSYANFILDTPVPFYIVSPLAELKFWHWYDIEGYYDGGNVKVSADGGTSWDIIFPDGGYPEDAASTGNSGIPGEPCYSASQTSWTEAVFDLSGYLGQSIIIRWHFGSDVSIEYSGWFIDDVSVSGAEIPDPGWLEGIVTEFGTGTPIEGAVVSITGTGFSATTLADGTYDIQDIWPGDYDITCVASLYLAGEELGYSIVEGLNTLNFSLLWSEIAVNVTELTSYLPPDETEVQTFIITNDGPGDLEYNISFEYPDETSGDNIPRPNYLPYNENYPRRKDVEPSAGIDLSYVRYENFFEEPSTDILRGSIAWFKAGEYSTYFYGTFDTDTPGDMTEILSPPAWNAYCGDFDAVNMDFFYTNNPDDFNTYTIDCATGAATLVGPTGLTSFLNGMACDKTEGTMYAVGSTDLYTIDLSTGAATLVGPLGNTGGIMLTLACDGDGELWGIDLTFDTLWNIDKDTGAGTEIGPVGFNCTYAQSMSWDPESDIVFWAAYGGGLDGNLRIVDTSTGATTLVGDFEGGREVTVLAFPGTRDTWVSITNNASGVVPANGGTVVVEVTFDTAELLMGDVLTADLLIHNNANYTATRGDDYVIPVTLTVSGNIPPSNLYVDEETGLCTWDAPPGPADSGDNSKGQRTKNNNDNLRDLLGYNVYLDTWEDPIGTTTATEWLYEDLVINQDYIAGVSAVYDDGESEIMEYPFTYIGSDAGDIIPLVTELRGNFPNPFNPETNIAFSIKEAGYTTLEVYNMKGQLVKTLVNEIMESGNYTATWNGKDNSGKSVSSSVYFYKMVSEGNSGRYTSTKKMILLK